MCLCGFSPHSHSVSFHPNYRSVYKHQRKEGHDSISDEKSSWLACTHILWGPLYCGSNPPILVEICDHPKCIISLSSWRIALLERDKHHRHLPYRPGSVWPPNIRSEHITQLEVRVIHLSLEFFFFFCHLWDVATCCSTQAILWPSTILTIRVALFILHGFSWADNEFTEGKVCQGYLSSHLSP